MTDSTNAVAYHNQLAEDWDARYRSGSFRRRAMLFSQTLLPLVPAGGHWLDAGCGSGYFSRALARSGATVVGIDASRSMLDQARELAHRDGLADDICFQPVVTVESLPFDDQTFDGCIALSVIEYLPNTNACLDEMVRILKPGGHLIVSIPHKRSVVRLSQRLLHLASGGRGKSLNYLNSSLHTTTIHEIRDALHRRGLKLIRTAGFDPVIPRPLHSVLPPSLIYVVACKR